MVQAADIFVNCNHKLTSFHTGPLYRHAKTLLHEPHALHMKQGEEKFPILELCLKQWFSREVISPI